MSQSFYVTWEEFHGLPVIEPGKDQHVSGPGVYNDKGQIIGRRPMEEFCPNRIPAIIVLDIDCGHCKKNRNDGNDDSDHSTRNTTKRSSEADDLVKFAMTECVTLFHDELKEPFAAVWNSIGCIEVMNCSSNIFRLWVAKLYWTLKEKGVNQNTLSIAVTTLKSLACFSGNTIPLHNRVSWSDNALWYDLGDHRWRAVRVDALGWQIAERTPILFRRYSHQKAQVEPMQSGNIRDLLKFINVPTHENQDLLLIWLICCFIPEFPHPILNIYGPQGSAKSFLCRLLRRLIDPSAIEVLSFPHETGLAQVFQHHWFLPFDNISYLKNDASDSLCKAVTGDGFTKRVLYSDDDDHVYTFQRCIALNGINLTSIRPDLLERSILLELERIPEEKRKPEYVVWQEFETALPGLLGSIFDTLSKALAIKKTVQIKLLPRMADFAIWGAAIAEVIGVGKDNFLAAYQKSIDLQNEEILNQDLVAQVIRQLMVDRNDWKGTCAQLHTELRIYLPQGMEKDWSWPKQPNKLSQRINRIKPNLLADGLEIKQYLENKERVICIKKLSSSSSPKPFDIFNL